MPFWKKDKEKKEERSVGVNRNFQDFLKAARLEMEGLMGKDPKWFYHLPYQGAMSWKRPKTWKSKKGPSGAG